MRAMLLAFVLIGVLSVGAYVALNHEEMGFSSAEQTSGSAVRLD